MKNFQGLFFNGMKRQLPGIVSYNGMAIDIGCSDRDKCVLDAEPLGRPNWVFPRDMLPYPNGSIATIHCYHFLEHLSGDDAIVLLRECERVMTPGWSVMNFCMPYYNSNLQAECLEHKSSWNEETFRNLFNSDGKKADIAGRWELRVHFQLIAGIVERNLCLIGQLVR